MFLVLCICVFVVRSVLCSFWHKNGSNLIVGDSLFDSMSDNFGAKRPHFQHPSAQRTVENLRYFFLSDAIFHYYIESYQIG